MADMIEMGGYASFVWSSYGITFLALGLLALGSFKAMKNAQKSMETLRETARPKRRSKSDTSND